METTRILTKYFVMSLFLVLTIAPSIYMIYDDFSISSYATVFFNMRHAHIFAKTVFLGASVAVASLVLGTLVAFCLECTDIPFKKLLSPLTVTPLMIPPYISTIAWMVLLGKRGDLVQVNVPFSIYNIQTAVVLLSLSYYPLIVLLMSFAIRNVDYRLEEAGLQYYPYSKVFRSITLKLVKPHAFIGSLFIFILTVSEYGTPSLLQVNVYMTEIFSEFSAFFNMGNAVALSLPLLVLILGTVLLIKHWFKTGTYVTISSFSRRRKVIRLTRLEKVAGVSFITALISASTVIPLTTLFVVSESRFAEAIMSAYDSIFASLWMAFLGAALLTCFSFMLAYFFRSLADPVVLSPLAVPSAMLAIGLIKIWNRPATMFIYGSPLIILIGYIARFLPFTVKAFTPFFQQVEPSVEESARLTGASFFKIVRRILMPLLRPAIVPVWTVGFILCLRELEVTLLLTPPGFQTLPNRIYTLLHYGDFGLVSALCLLMVALIIIPLLVIMGSKKIIRWAI